MKACDKCGKRKELPPKCEHFRDWSSLSVTEYNILYGTMIDKLLCHCEEGKG